jgi:hypothetical membrane protein
MRQRNLLWCAAAGAALFIFTFLVNDALKPGYEPTRDFVSEAAIGPGGWVQIGNFLVTGALIAASSAAISRSVNTWSGRLTGVFGVSLVLAGIFVTDPAPHDHATWSGTAHNVVSLIAFASLTATCFTAAQWRPTGLWRWYCVLSGTAVPVLFVIAGAASDTSGLWQRLSIMVGWTWLAVLALRALPIAASPAQTSV